MAQFEVYEDRGKKFRWRLKSRNGEIVADGTVAYGKVAEAQRAVADFVAAVAADDAAAIAEDKAGRWRWSLAKPVKADSGQSYAAERTAKEAYGRVRATAPDAAIVDRTGGGENPAGDFLPVAVLAPIAPGIEPHAVTLDATRSYDPDGAIVAYHWSVDGAPLTAPDGADAPHATAVATLGEGEHVVAVTVVDNEGHRSTAERRVAVAAAAGPPPPEMVTVTPAAAAIQLVWAPVAKAAAYQVRRFRDDTDEEVVADAKDASYVDTAVRSGAVYEYSVASVGAGKNGKAGAWSRPVEARLVPPIAPSVDGRLDVSWLHEGESPVQAADDGAIDTTRAAIVRGRVLDRNGAGLAGVSVAIHEQPAVGAVRTRRTGEFEIAANGGGLVVVTLAKDGYVRASRRVEPRWGEIASIGDVLLADVADSLEDVDLSGAAGAAQVLPGSTSADDAGTRKTLLVIPAGTALASDPADRPTDTVPRIGFTEVTAGAGPAGMPAELPPTTAFTYAIDLRLDGAANASFTKPVVHYVTNFLGVPVGSPVPVGYFDEAKQDWVAEDDGVVIGVLSV
ncbi:MAG TPA: DUF1508 domain-containing protein, partial [Acidimicrobiales bacterium]